MSEYIIQTNLLRCPVCSGALDKLNYRYQCNDCKRAFKIVGAGYNTREVRVKEIAHTN